MTVDIQIVPLFDSVDLYGSPDVSSAYSLAGHVELSLSSSHSFFERPRSERVRLESLELKFEGQSELITEATGYSAARLCTITRELVQGDAIELSNEDALNQSRDLASSKSASATSKWEVVFDIPVPGWLPASSSFGDVIDGTAAGNQYALYATARFRDLKTDTTSSFSSLLCGMFRSPLRTLKARRKVITLNRLRTTSTYADNAADFPLASYVVQTKVKRPADSAFDERTFIPMEVLQAIDVAMDVPEHLDVNRKDVPLSLRMRVVKELEESKREKVKVIGFNMDLCQVETYRSKASSSYTRVFPLPPASQQPPKLPLLSPHPMEHLFALGIMGGPLPAESGQVAEFSLLPQDPSRKSFRVANGGMSLNGDGWAKFDISAKLDDECLLAGKDKPQLQQTGFHRRIRTTSESPLMGVKHHLVMELLCGFEHPADGDRPAKMAYETLHFSLPLSFVTSAPPHRSPTSSTIALLSGSQQDLYPSQQMTKMPAYSQLFYPNGDPREDHWEADVDPLPMYCKEADTIANESLPLLASH